MRYQVKGRSERPGKLPPSRYSIWDNRLSDNYEAMGWPAWVALDGRELVFTSVHQAEDWLTLCEERGLDMGHQGITLRTYTASSAEARRRLSQGQ